MLRLQLLRFVLNRRIAFDRNDRLCLCDRQQRAALNRIVEPRLRVDYNRPLVSRFEDSIEQRGNASLPSVAR